MVVDKYKLRFKKVLSVFCQKMSISANGKFPLEKNVSAFKENLKNSLNGLVANTRKKN